MGNVGQRRKRIPYYQTFSELYERFDGDSFMQSIIDHLYQKGVCSFSKKELLGDRISLLLSEVGIPYTKEHLNDATFMIQITRNI